MKKRPGKRKENRRPTSEGKGKKVKELLRGASSVILTLTFIAIAWQAFTLSSSLNEQLRMNRLIYRPFVYPDQLNVTFFHLSEDPETEHNGLGCTYWIKNNGALPALNTYTVFTVSQYSEFPEDAIRNQLEALTTPYGIIFPGHAKESASFPIRIPGESGNRRIFLHIYIDYQDELGLHHASRLTYHYLDELDLWGTMSASLEPIEWQRE